MDPHDFAMRAFHTTRHGAFNSRKTLEQMVHEYRLNAIRKWPIAYVFQALCASTRGVPHLEAAVLQTHRRWIEEMGDDRTTTFDTWKEKAVRNRKPFSMLNVEYSIEANNTLREFNQAFHFDIRPIREWMRELPMPAEFADYDHSENVSLQSYMTRCFAHFRDADPPEDARDNLLDGLHKLSPARRAEIKKGGFLAKELWPDVALMISICGKEERDAACDETTLKWTTQDAARIFGAAYDEKAMDLALREMLTHEGEMLDALNLNLHFLSQIPSMDTQRVLDLLAYVKNHSAADIHAIQGDREVFIAGVQSFMDDPASQDLARYSVDFRYAIANVFPGAPIYFAKFKEKMLLESPPIELIVMDIMCTSQALINSPVENDQTPRVQMYKFRTHLDYIDFIVDGGVEPRKTIALALDIDTVRGGIDVAAVWGQKHVNDNVRIKVHWKKVHDDHVVVGVDFLNMWLKFDTARCRWFKGERNEELRALANEGVQTSKVFSNAYNVWNKVADIVRKQGVIKRALISAGNANRILEESTRIKTKSHRSALLKGFYNSLTAFFARTGDTTKYPWIGRESFPNALILELDGSFQMTKTKGLRPFIVAVDDEYDFNAQVEFAQSLCEQFELETEAKRVRFGVDRLAWKLREATDMLHAAQQTENGKGHIELDARWFRAIPLADMVLVRTNGVLTAEACEPGKHPYVLEKNVDVGQINERRAFWTVRIDGLNQSVRTAPNLAAIVGYLDMDEFQAPKRARIELPPEEADVPGETLPEAPPEEEAPKEAEETLPEAPPEEEAPKEAEDALPVAHEIGHATVPVLGAGMEAMFPAFPEQEYCLYIDQGGGVVVGDASEFGDKRVGMTERGYLLLRSTNENLVALGHAHMQKKLETVKLKKKIKGVTLAKLNGFADGFTSVQEAVDGGAGIKESLIKYV